MVCPVKDGGGEDCVGLGYGQDRQHGLCQRWPIAEPRSVHQPPIHERNG